MTVSIILVVVAFLALVFLIRLTKGRALAPHILENPGSHLRAVDVEAFRNLMDPSEEEFLRSRLEPHEFRKLERERLRAAIEYLSAAAENAAILLRLGEAARRGPDAATAAAADKLIDDAIRLRLYAFQALPRLYLAMILPGMPISPARVADSYERMTRQVILLGLQHPPSGVSSAL